MARTYPATLPDKATWYLATNLPRPDGPHATGSIHPPADLAEVVRLYELRPWIEQSYKQIKDELGWADSQVRSATAIHRHQPQPPCWPRALRAVRAWLTPVGTLRRRWRAWSDKDPPAKLQPLLHAVSTLAT